MHWGIAPWREEAELGVGFEARSLFVGGSGGWLSEELEDRALLWALEACSGSVEDLVALYRFLAQEED